jgi:hypothetical protein
MPSAVILLPYLLIFTGLCHYAIEGCHKQQKNSHPQQQQRPLKAAFELMNAYVGK